MQSIHTTCTRRYCVCAGEHIKLVSTLDGRFPDFGHHLPNEMAGFGCPPSSCWTVSGCIFSTGTASATAGCRRMDTRRSLKGISFISGRGWAPPPSRSTCTSWLPTRRAAWCCGTRCATPAPQNAASCWIFSPAPTCARPGAPGSWTPRRAAGTASGTGRNTRPFTPIPRAGRGMSCSAPMSSPPAGTAATSRGRTGRLERARAAVCILNGNWMPGKRGFCRSLSRDPFLRWRTVRRSTA